MTSLERAPVSVQRWFAAEKSLDPAEALRAVLAPDVIFDFGGRKVLGVDSVIGTLGFMMPPGWLGPVEWSVLSLGDDGRVTVRGTGPNGVPLPSPGGPMSAIEFTFMLNDEGLISLIAAQPHHPEPPGLRQALRAGETAPDFILPDVGGVQVPLRQQGVRATIVVFTCNHCPFSLAWHERLQQVGRDYATHGVRFLNINPNDPAVNPVDGLERSRERVAAGEFAGPYLMDTGQTVARSWGARHTPEVFVLDKDGKVFYHGAPDADVSDDTLAAGWLRGALDHLLAGTKPNPAETPPVGCSIKWSSR